MENKTNSPIYWTLLTHEDWNMHIAATSKGLCYVGSQNQSFEELAEWSNARFPDSTVIRDEEKMQPYAAELLEYLQGTRISFTIPFDFHGTPFQLSVIPCHRVIGKNGALTGYRGGMAWT